MFLCIWSIDFAAMIVVCEQGLMRDRGSFYDFISEPRWPLIAHSEQHGDTDV